MNRLAGETSPYLLQHAHNPVDWYPWGDEAIGVARQHDKPILLSIGYSACHWCHVMERESFEDPAVAAIMNKHFVNIKIDREERSDLDHIYMEAVQALAGSGGWPLNVFLTPDLKPFYGGTYFPPQRAFNRSSWRDVLLSISKIYREQRGEVNKQADNLTQHLFRSNQFGQSHVHINSEGIFSDKTGDLIKSAIVNAADRIHGGFGDAPKFPQTFTIQYLLHHYYHTKDQFALDHATLSLEKMIMGGIYDQIGGGFARYSTDQEWLVPHFEKMLYDNALLVMAMSEAFQLTGRDIYREAVEGTIKFIEREMTSPEGAFYAALDADSEGVEGRFYVWSKDEIYQLLGDDAVLFCEYYGVSEMGNWEHTNILHATVSLDEFAASKQVDVISLVTKLKQSGATLLEAREKRVRPGLDDKILLGWNALMVTAYAKAYAAFGREQYKERAIASMALLLKKFDAGSGKLFHTYKDGHAKYPAFLDDYAFTIYALVHLQEITSDGQYLERARTLCKHVLDNFSEEGTGFFFFTGKDQQDVVIRKKDLYDGAVPSGNSVMAWNLYYLGVVFDESDWKERSLRACSSLYDVVTKYPTSFGFWATNILGHSYGVPEIALTGQHIQKLHNEFLRTFIPFRIFQSSTQETKYFPLLAGKKISEKPLLFVCKDYACKQPVSDVKSLIRLLEHV